MFPGCTEHCNTGGTLSEYSRNIACRLGRGQHFYFLLLVFVKRVIFATSNESALRNFNSNVFRLKFGGLGKNLSAQYVYESFFTYQFQTHVKLVCPKEKVLCQNERCCMLVFRSNLDNHMENSCQYRLLVCIHCTEEYKYINQEVEASFPLKAFVKYYIWKLMLPEV